MSLPQAIKTMLHGVSGISNDQITYGQRNQQAGLPAVTYLITSNNILTIGTPADALKSCVVEIRAYATIAEDAQTYAESAVGQLATGTYNAIEFEGLTYEPPILQEPTGGEGEESEPFVCLVTTTIYYKE